MDLDHTQAAYGDRVRVHYTGRLEDGSVFESSTGAHPLEFTIGDGTMIPGFEEAVVGMAPGDSKLVTVSEDAAYGPYRPELVEEYARRDFPEDFDIEVGQAIELSLPHAEPRVYTVTEVTEETVTLDGNHPLAGNDLLFQIQLEDILTA